MDKPASRASVLAGLAAGPSSVAGMIDSADSHRGPGVAAPRRHGSAAPRGARALDTGDVPALVIFGCVGQLDAVALRLLIDLAGRNAAATLLRQAGLRPTQ